MRSEDNCNNRSGGHDWSSLFGDDGWPRRTGDNLTTTWLICWWCPARKEVGPLNRLLGRKVEDVQDLQGLF